MKVSLALFLCLGAIAAVAASGEDDFECPEPSGYFGDPQNCMKYYHCFNNRVEEHLSCPFADGQQELYDANNVMCNWPDKVNCQGRPVCDANGQNCHEQEDGGGDDGGDDDGGDFDFDCPQPSGYFADPDNCIQYYHCFNGTVEEHLTCPFAQGKQELYDEANVMCNWPEMVSCGERPICDTQGENCHDQEGGGGDDDDIDFDCPEDNGWFADPDNCIKYYHCFNGNPEQHLTCPIANGIQELYDPVNEWCDWPDRVECGERPICDANDENCDVQPTEPPTTPYTGPSTTTRYNKCGEYGSCTPSGNEGGYHSEGPCEQCFCQCVLGGIYEEVCCQPGLFFNPTTNLCDWDYNIDTC